MWNWYLLIFDQRGAGELVGQVALPELSLETVRSAWRGSDPELLGLELRLDAERVAKLVRFLPTDIDLQTYTYSIEYLNDSGMPWSLKDPKPPGFQSSSESASKPHPA